jgi:hypothetical protein
MRRLSLIGTVLTLAGFAFAAPAVAHPAPFSYLDIRVESRALEVTLVAHIFDVAHDLGVEPPEQLLDAKRLDGGPGSAFAALLRDRLALRVDGQVLRIANWSAAEPLPDRQSIRLNAHVPLDRAPGIIGVTAHMFPYDVRQFLRRRSRDGPDDP